jgi:4-hydroxy-tetrahydrodipicolinate reductase
MLTVSIFGAGQLGKGVSGVIRGRSYDVRGPYKRTERKTALTSGADVVIIATTTRLRDVASDIELAVRSGSDVLVSAEECAYPFAVDADLAGRLDQLAREFGVSIAGCGVNPGLIFDSLVLTFLGAAPGDCRIEVRRTVDLSQFGSTVLRRIGLGRDEKSFADAAERQEILGHAGFPQSMHVVAAALGLSVEKITKQLRPVMTLRAIDLPGRLSIKPGESAGVDQTYSAFVGGNRWFTCHFFGHVDLGDIGRVAGDDIELYRAETLLHTLQIRPGIPAQAGSQNMVANSIDRIVDARPGWRTVAELAPAHPHGEVEAQS